jgi:hypothetical protein
MFHGTSTTTNQVLYYLNTDTKTKVLRATERKKRSEMDHARLEDGGRVVGE